jgi:hypothetical protein
MQNRASGGLTVPQTEHPAGAIRVPHEMQNLAPGSFAVPQFGQAVRAMSSGGYGPRVRVQLIRNGPMLFSAASGALPSTVGSSGSLSDLAA